jgi:Putative prokaryotic signal transducing protein
VSDEPVVVRTFLSSTDAEMARSALEAAGIPSMVRSDDCGGMRPHLWMGGVGLLVPADAAEAASALLDELESQAPDADPQLDADS